MKDMVKIKLADEILKIIDELSDESESMYEEDELFNEKESKPIVKIKVKGK